MRFQMVARVIGEAYASRPVTGLFHGIEVELQADPASHRVTQVALTVPAEETVAKLRGRSRQTGPIPTLTIPPTPRAAEMRSLLQYLESVGSFWFSCERIKWGEPELRWIPETDEERDLLDMTTFQVTSEYEPHRVPVNDELLRYLLDAEPVLSRYTVPLAFYREGEREHAANRYLYAFFNFYFFLEDLFAEGKFKTLAVEQAFLKSKELRAAVEYAIRRLQEHNEVGHLDELTRLGQQLGCDLTIEGTIALIVQMRGNLHHFSSSSPRPKGHPLNQHEFEALSVLMLGICVAVVAGLMPGGGPEYRAR